MITHWPTNIFRFVLHLFNNARSQEALGVRLIELEKEGKTERNILESLKKHVLRETRQPRISSGIKYEK